jgi:hypothetical protein
MTYSVRFAIFFSKLQMYVLSHNIMKNGYNSKFLHEFVVVLASEILANDISNLYMDLNIHIHYDIPK